MSRHAAQESGTSTRYSRQETLQKLTDRFENRLQRIRQHERDGGDVYDLHVQTLYMYVEELSDTHQLLAIQVVNDIEEEFARRESSLCDENKSLLLKINHLEEELLVDCEVREERLTEQNNILSEGAAQLEQQLSDQGRKTKWLESMVSYLKEKNRASQHDAMRNKTHVKHLEGKLQQMRCEVKILNQKLELSQKIVFSHQVALKEVSLQNDSLLQDLDICKVAYEYETARLFQSSHVLCNQLKAATQRVKLLEQQNKQQLEENDYWMAHVHFELQHQQNDQVSGKKLHVRLNQHEDLLCKLQRDVQELLKKNKAGCMTSMKT